MIDGISIIIPYYNKPTTLERAIESASSQISGVPFEIIVIDDASSDIPTNLFHKLNSLGVKWITLNNNSGPSIARNKGLDHAQFSHVSFLDADDYWHPNFLESIVNVFSRCPDMDLVSTGYILKTPSMDLQCYDNRTREKVIHYQGLEYFNIGKVGITPIISSAVVAKKKSIIEAGMFPRNIHEAEDLWLWSKLALNNSHFAFINRCAATYDMTHSTEVSRLKKNIEQLPHLKMLEDLFSSGIDEIPMEIKEYVSDFKRMFFFRLAIYQPRHAKKYLLSTLDTLIPAKLDLRAKILMRLPVASFAFVNKINNISILIDRYVLRKRIMLIPVYKDEKNLKM